MEMLHACGEQVQMLGWGSNCSLLIYGLGNLGLLSCRDRDEGLYVLLRWRFLFMGGDGRFEETKVYSVSVSGIRASAVNKSVA